MKKLLFLALAALAAVTSCMKGSQDSSPEANPVSSALTKASPGMKTISVTLGCSGIETKTVLVDTLIYWMADDINIACVTTDGAIYALTSSETTQAASKTFTGEIPEEKTPLYYYYDMNRNSGWGISLKNGHTLRESLPNNKDCWTANSFPTAMNFAIAKPGDTAMKNVHGYFKWTNNGNAIKSVKFEAITDREYLAGYFDVRYDETEPVTSKFYYLEDNPKYCSSYVISSIGYTAIPADMCYYAIVIPGTYHGLRITINLDNGNSFALITEGTIVVERSAFIDFGVLPTTPCAITAGGCTFVPEELGWEDIAPSDPFSPNWDNL